MSTEKDLYFVAVKVFLIDSDGRLLITKDRFGDWDIPGGRLRGVDFETPLPDVVERKMREELGSGVRYTLGVPTVFMRHERQEVLPSGEKELRRIFAIGYAASYEGGDVILGKSHEKFEWVVMQDFKPQDYFSGGWLAGVKEFVAQYGAH